MKQAKLLKSAVVGMIGSLLMFLVMMFAIHGAGIAPFDLPPSAAFLEKLGINVGPLPLLVHFGYGATWSVVLVYLFQEETDLMKGLLFAGGLWLFMMVVYSPVIGWGFFGFGGADIARDSKLYLEPGPKYAVATLLLHVLYGIVIGAGNPLWLELKSSGEPAVEA